MKKIFSFLNLIGDKIKSLVLSIWHKIFPPKNDNFFKKGLLVGTTTAAILLIIAFSLLYYKGVIGKKAEINEPIKMKITIVTKKDCPECWNTNLFVDALSQQEFKITNKKTVYVDGKSLIPFINDGDNLVKKFNITKLPTVILEADFEKNKDLVNFLTPNLGDIIDGKFVLRKVIPPYIDVSSGQLKGKVQIIYLTDDSCKECYDVNIHNNALSNLGVPINNIEKIDISTEAGKKLISDYKIKAVPTLLIKGEVGEYQSLTTVWPDVGTIAADGTYVFTDLSIMNGAYKDLTKNKVVQPAATK